MVYRRKSARPFRNSGVRYVPKQRKHELEIQKKLCNYVRKTYPHVVFHSDYGANVDLTEYQAKLNKALQSRHKFPDIVFLAPGRINPSTNKPYIALAIELKKDGTTVILKIGPNKGKLSTNEHIREQAKTLRVLNKQGWYANFAVGYDAAKQMIDWYFNNENAPIF